MYKRRGISLIVLVITILVMIILAGVVVVSLQKNNPIERSKEARFKTNVVSYLDELNMTLLGEEYASGLKVINKTGDLKEFIPSFKNEDEGKFEIKNNRLCYTGDSIDEELMAGEIGVIPNGNRKVFYEKLIPEAEQKIDGINNINVIPIQARINNKVIIEFEAKPTRETNFEKIGHVNNWQPNQNTLLQAHPGIKKEDEIFVGINLGTNGINTIEHANDWYPFPIIYKADLSARHKYQLFINNKTTYLFIDGNYINKSVSNSKVVGIKSTQIGGGYYGKYVGELYNFKISTPIK